MQGTVGGSWRPCTALLHQSGFCVAKGLGFARFSSFPDLHRRWYRSHVQEDVRRCGVCSSVWDQTEMKKLGVGFEAWRERLPRRELLSTVVAARRSVLHELQSLRNDEADYSGQIEYESPLQVVLYPDPRLRAKNKIINVFDEKLQQLVQEMFDIMYKTDGVGLAAPQVGVNVRLMVYNPVGERGQGEEYVLVNPQIVKYGKNQDVFAEGCLSFPTFGSDPKKAPTIEADVERPKSVRVEAQDIKGKKFAMTLKEWQARIFQHEYDHLEGTLYFDRMSPEVLDSIQLDLKKLEELYEQRTGLPAPEKISNKI